MSIEILNFNLGVSPQSAKWGHVLDASNKISQKIRPMGLPTAVFCTDSASNFGFFCLFDLFP